MDPDRSWVVALAEGADCEDRLVGGKAAKLAQLARAGFRVPPGFLITALAYETFVKEAGLDRAVRMELGRKPLESMRWEELWDAALRIRSAFLAAPIPPAVGEAIRAAVRGLGPDRPLAVRSSAPGEDSAQRSFAGLHESVVGVVGPEAVLDAVQVVWASLWSDAALLYRQELGLDPGQSRMAVVVQAFVDEDRSGVAFGRDPREPALDHAIIEAVTGPCGDLVDGAVDPDRWVLDRTTGEVLSWRPGERDEGAGEIDRADGGGEPDERGAPILDPGDLGEVLGTVLRIESLFGWPPDTEWTGRRDRLTVLQARPITTGVPAADDPRSWYLSLRPGMRRLAALARRVADELIPELEGLGARFASEPIETLDDGALAAAIAERAAALEHWRRIYHDDFIPFAHGARQLGTYYNDAVRPADPYEFVGLLRGERMVAVSRNRALEHLAGRAREDADLRAALQDVHDAAGGDGTAPGNQPFDWRASLRARLGVDRSREVIPELEALLEGFMDVAYNQERLSDRPGLVFGTILELAAVSTASGGGEAGGNGAAVSALERRLFEAVGADRREEAREVLEIGRLSWRLRDDDNLLVGRIESQLLRAIQLGVERLRNAGRLGDGGHIPEGAAVAVAEALLDARGGPVELPAAVGKEPVANAGPGARTGSAAPTGPRESPRQMVGQPASPGIATGLVRVVRGTDDLGRFRAGEVLVCDAIQPTMSHLVPLAAAIVERRGGMLIHGAIIARELGIPCVNGVSHAAERLEGGQIVTVDGYLGIVTVGAPEFDLELSPVPGGEARGRVP